MVHFTQSYTFIDNRQNSDVSVTSVTLTDEGSRSSCEVCRLLYRIIKFYEIAQTMSSMMKIRFTLWDTHTICVLIASAISEGLDDSAHQHRQHAGASLIACKPYTYRCRRKLQTKLRRKLQTKLRPLNNEPRHEISNNVVCATRKDFDQPAHTRRLTRAIASRLNFL